MAKLKERIRETAKNLFEERGYDSVSLRIIAAEAGTTIGNLTYHYPQKEDLLIAIQEACQADFLGGAEKIPEVSKDVLSHIISVSRRIERSHNENIFYFKNIVKICHDFSFIYKNTENMRKKIYNIYLECFDRLRNSGYMRRDIKISNYNNLAYLVVVMSTIWPQDSLLYNNESLPHPSLYETIIDIIYPYLTTEGIALLKKI